MSSSHELPEPHDLDAFLDGTLAGSAREEVVREIERDRRLRADVELQGKIDATIRRSFVAPEIPAALLATLQQAAVPRSPVSPMANGKPRFGRGSITLWSAILVTCLIWGYVGWQFMPSLKQRAVPRPNDLASIYQRQLIGDGHGHCTPIDTGAFGMTFQSLHGQALRLRPLPAGTEILGTMTCSGVSPSTTTLLAHFDKTQVMVFVDRRDNETRLETPAACSGLKLYRKELGELVAYELSPFDTPHVIDHFTSD